MLLMTNYNRFMNMNKYFSFYLLFKTQQQTAPSTASATSAMRKKSNFMTAGQLAASHWSS